MTISNTVGYVILCAITEQINSRYMLISTLVVAYIGQVYMAIFHCNRSWS